jgi:hypothetical protein
VARWVPRARRGPAQDSVTSVTQLPAVRPGEDAVRTGEPAQVAARRDAGSAPSGGEEAVDAGPVRPQHPLAGTDVEAPQCDARRREQQAAEMARHRRVRPGTEGSEMRGRFAQGIRCPLQAQQLYSSTAGSSADAGTPILSARTQTDGAILWLTNRLTDPKSRVKTMWLALPSSSWRSGRPWSGGPARTCARPSDRVPVICTRRRASPMPQNRAGGLDHEEATRQGGSGHLRLRPQLLKLRTGL